MTICDTANPCRNGAQCVAMDDGGYKCNCPLNFQGPQCEIRESFNHDLKQRVGLCLHGLGRRNSGEKGWRHSIEFKQLLLRDLTHESSNMGLGRIKDSSHKSRSHSKNLICNVDLSKLMFLYKKLSFVGSIFNVHVTASNPS